MTRLLWAALLAALLLGAAPRGAPAPAYGLAGGATTATVPFSFVDRRIAVQALVDGRGPFTFVLDSGAGNTMSARLAAELGLQNERRIRIGGTGAARVPATVARVASLELGGVRMTNQRFIVVDMSEIRKATALPSFDGLIGSELLAHFVVRVDYRTQTLTVTLPSAFSYHGAGTVVPVTLRAGMPFVAASVDGIAGRFLLDTGDRMDVTLMEPIIAKDALLARYAPRVATITGWGIGGAVPGYVARAHDVRIGGLDVADPLLRLPTVAGGFFTSSHLTGSIGTGVTDRYTLTFDYPRNRLIFEDPAPPRRDAYDRSGLWLNQGDGAFDVAAVADGSPAERAGILEGDRIVAVDGTEAAALTLAGVRKRLRGLPGTQVVLTVAHGGDPPNDVPLTLEDLV